MPDLTYAVIGAGPSGLAAARNLQRRGIPWAGYELGDDVGGLWNIDGPRSTVYESAHLISSKRTTEFAEFPMARRGRRLPEPPRAAGVLPRVRRRFGLRDGFEFGTEVVRAEPAGGGWAVTVRTPAGERTERSTPASWSPTAR